MANKKLKPISTARKAAMRRIPCYRHLFFVLSIFTQNFKQFFLIVFTIKRKWLIMSVIIFYKTLALLRNFILPLIYQNNNKKTSHNYESNNINPNQQRF
jgi:hypothetical protein